MENDDSGQTQGNQKQIKQDHTTDNKDDKFSIYPERLARKYHFVEVYMRQHKLHDDAIKSLYQEPPKSKHTLKQLLSQNFKSLQATAPTEKPADSALEVDATSPDKPDATGDGTLTP